jgi:hypothetical protein
MRMVFTTCCLLLSALLAFSVNAGQPKIVLEYTRTSIHTNVLQFFEDNSFQWLFGASDPHDDKTTEGVYRNNGNRIVLSWKRMTDTGILTDSLEMYQIRWGKANILVGEGDLVKVCNDYNQNQYSDSSTRAFYRQVGLPYYCLKNTTQSDSSWYLDGKPDLPEPWYGYLYDEAINATITTIKSKEYRITIDKGMSGGVYLGAEFFGPFKAFGYMTLSVIDLYADSSVLTVPDEFELIDYYQELLSRTEVIQDSNRLKAINNTYVAAKDSFALRFGRLVLGDTLSNRRLRRD